MTVLISAAEFRRILTATPESRAVLEKIGMVIIEEMLRLQASGLSDEEVSVEVSRGMTKAMLGAPR